MSSAPVSSLFVEPFAEGLRRWLACLGGVSGLLLFCLLTVVAPSDVQGAQEDYTYDPNGRVSRIDRSDGKVMVFDYDAVGNLLGVNIFDTATEPVVDSVDPATIRRGESGTITLNGSRLTDAVVNTASLGLTVSDVIPTEQEVTFTLTAAAEAALGAQLFTVSTSSGEGVFSVEVRPATPRLLISPLPLALPVDSGYRSLLIRLSNTDVVSRDVSLSIEDTTVAELDASSVSIPVGETEASVRIRGFSNGTTKINLESDGLDSVSFPVYVTTEYGSISTANASALGVLRELPTGGTQSVGPIASPLVQVVKGAHLRGLSPAAISVDSEVLLTIEGQGLHTSTGVTIEPSAGITIEDFSAAADSASVTVNVSVDAGASIGYRRVRLSGIGTYPAASDYADRLLITAPLPEIHSIEPYFAVKGSGSQQLRIRGRNLNSPTGVSFTPAEDITVGTDASSNSAGTELTVTFTVDASADSGERLVQVLTPAGLSTDQAGASNTLEVVSGVSSVHSPIVSAQLGVFKGEDGGGGTVLSSGAFSPPVGVMKGATLVSIAPAKGQIGTEVDMHVEGTGLVDGMTVSVFPAQGIVAGPVIAAPDGNSLTTTLTISADADQTERRLRVLTASGTELMFADPSAAKFRVTGVEPAIAAVSPNTLQVGASPVVLRVYGSNLQNASHVAVTPSDGVSVGPPTVAGDGGYLDVTVTVAPNAATGERVLIVTTPAGTTETSQTAANMLVLYETSGGVVTPVVSALLGVVKQDETDLEIHIDSLTSASLGVLVEEDVRVPQDLFVTSESLGVAIGPVATGIDVGYLRPGVDTTLTVYGKGFGQDTVIGVIPSNDLAVGDTVVAADGMNVSVSLTLYSGAQTGSRRVVLLSNDVPVPFAPAREAIIVVGSGEPTLDSISPILADRGDTLTLTLRGQYLDMARRIYSEPGAGLKFGSIISVSTDGTEATVELHIAEDAPAGATTIRIETAGGQSSSASSAANTFTVY